MNTPQEAMRTAASRILHALDEQQEEACCKRITASLTLHHAQGSRFDAGVRVAKALERQALDARMLDDAALEAGHACNLLAAATLASTHVRTAVVNAATAASDAQSASRAIAQVAADLGAALNVATATLFGTDLYQHVLRANSLAGEVAMDAEQSSLDTFRASTLASQVIADEVCGQAQATKVMTDALLALLQAQWSRSSQVAAEARLRGAVASRDERDAEGALSDAQHECAALDAARTTTSDRTNFGLAVNGPVGDVFEVRFHAMPDGLFQPPPGQGAPLPPLDPVYHLAIVPASMAGLFTIDLAEQLRLPKDGEEIDTAHFMPASPDRCTTISKDQGVDAFGDRLVPGMDYVAFLFIQIGLPYKRFTGRFSDLLSAPSRVFTLATVLPAAVASGTGAADGPDGNVSAIMFHAPRVGLPAPAADGAGLQFRVMLVRREAPRTAQNTGEDSHSRAVHFNADIAMLVTPPNFLAINQPPEDVQPAPPPADGNSGSAARQGKAPCSPAAQVVEYRVPVPADATDIAGNPIEADCRYTPCVLSIVVGDAAVARQFVPALSTALPPLVLARTRSNGHCSDQGVRT